MSFRPTIDAAPGRAAPLIGARGFTAFNNGNARRQTGSDRGVSPLAITGG